jgi:hypothetical protein
MTSTSALMLLHNQIHVRSQQRELGWSDIGGCRRRARYVLDGYEPVNQVSSVVAMIGTAVHKQIQAVLEALGLPAEWEVEYAGIKGHFDRYEEEFHRLVDTKTISSRYLESLKLHGPPTANRWQVSGYAAGMIINGYKVKTCRLDYLTRDTGEEWQYEWYFDPQDVKDALEWLKDVKDVPFDLVPRDYEPDSAWCQGCPFGGRDGGICWQGGVPDRDPRSVMLAEGVKAAEAAQELFLLRKQIKDMDARAKELKGILDGLRPDDPGVIVKAGDMFLSWSPTGRGDSYQLRFTSPPQPKVV